MKQDKPLVSVIIPVYNCERYLAEAVESVLAQTYRPVEILVVDDGSTDGSADVAKAFAAPVLYSYKPHSGLGDTRNKGVTLAHGDFFAFLDADDIWMPDKLAVQIPVFDATPQIEMVFGFVEQFCSPEIPQEERPWLKKELELLPGQVAGTMVIRKEAFFRAGLFATHWHVGEFIDWYLKATERGIQSLTVNKVVTRRRLHSANMGLRERNFRTDYLKILKASLDRRRSDKPIPEF